MGGLVGFAVGITGFLSVPGTLANVLGRPPRAARPRHRVELSKTSALRSPQPGHGAVRPTASAVFGSLRPRGNPNLSTDAETASEERPDSAPVRTKKPLDATAATPGLGTGTPTSGESTVSDEAGEEHTVAGDPAVMPEGVSETSHGAAAISDPAVRRSSMSSRHSTPKAVERWRSQGELDSDADGQAPSNRPDGNVSRTRGQAVDIGTVAHADIDAVESAEAQTTASSTLFSTSLSTTAVDRDPLIARAAPTAEEEPSIITRLLAPLGIGALATNTPVAPASPTSLMGFLELVRRELDRIFVNDSPTFTYDSAENIAANGVITGKVTPVDTDSTDFTYTATSPAEGDVFIDADGTFTFTPNENYDPNTGASFAVTISDASSDFHIHGLPGLLNLVTFGLIGESGHTQTETIAVSGVVPPPDFQRTGVVSGLTEPTDFRFLPRLTPQRSRSHPHRRERRGDQGIQRQRNAEQR